MNGDATASLTISLEQRDAKCRLATWVERSGDNNEFAGGVSLSHGVLAYRGTGHQAMISILGSDVLDPPLRPQTKYTNSGAVTIAYQVVGSAALDLLYIPGWFFNPEVWGSFVPIRRYLERLTSFSRVICVENEDLACRTGYRRRIYRLCRSGWLT